MAWSDNNQGTYGTRAEQIKRQMAYADALRKSGMQSPEGKMVSGIYVVPNFADYFSPVIQSGFGSYFGSEAEKEQAANEAKAAKEAADFVLPSAMKTITKSAPGPDVPAPAAPITQQPNSPFGTTEAGPVAPGTVLPQARAQMVPSPNVTTQEQEMKSIPEYTNDVNTALTKIDPTNPYMATTREAVLKQALALPTFAMEQAQKHEDNMAALQLKQEEEARQADIRHEERMHQLKTDSDRAEETVRHNREQEEIARRHDQEWAIAQKELAASRRESAAASNSAAQDRLQQGNARLEDNLSRQFDAQAKDATEEVTQTRKLKQFAPTMLGRRPNAIEQQSMMVLLNKFLDPNSVVREGEFNRVATAQGMYERAGNLYDRITKGEPMSDRLIKDMTDVADMYEKAASGKIATLGNLYVDKAKRRGLVPENVVVNPYYVHAGSGSANRYGKPPPGAVQEIP
jgi:hypothetical protein